METDVETPEWTIIWTLRKYIKTLNRETFEVTEQIAKDITESLELMNWRLIKIPLEPQPPGLSDPMREALFQRRREERESFEALLDAVLRAWRAIR